MRMGLVGAAVLVGGAVASAATGSLPFDAEWFDFNSVGYINNSANGWRQLASTPSGSVAEAAVFADTGYQFLQAVRNDSIVSYWTPFESTFVQAPTVSHPSVFATFDIALADGNDQAFHGFYAKNASGVFLSAGVGSDGNIYFGGTSLAQYSAADPFGVYFDVLFDMQNKRASVSVFDYDDVLLAGGEFALPASATNVTEMGFAAYSMGSAVPAVGDSASIATYYNLAIDASANAVPEPVALFGMIGGALLLGLRPRRKSRLA